MKHCNLCDQDKPDSAFFPSRPSACKDCTNARRRKHYQDNKSELAQQILAARFSMTPQELAEFKAQPCAICAKPGPSFVDHDHACCPRKGESCGECIRGPLCGDCNRGLGAFLDNPELLQAAINYLEANMTTTQQGYVQEGGQ